MGEGVRMKLSEFIEKNTLECKGCPAEKVCDTLTNYLTYEGEIDCEREEWLSFIKRIEELALE